MSAKYNDFWKLAAGCPKIGHAISRWNNSGSNPTCRCCNYEFKIECHLYMLRLVRDLLVTSGQQWLGITINTSNAKDTLNRVLYSNVESRSRGDTGLWYFVVALNKVIWDYHNRIVFEQVAFVFEVLKSRSFTSGRPLYKDLTGDKKVK